MTLTIQARAVAIAVALGVSSGPLAGQLPGQLLESSLKARRLVTDAVAAIGGAAALNALTEVEYAGRGSLYNDTQDFDPLAATRPSPATLSVVLDYKDSLFFQMIDSPPPGMFGAPVRLFFKAGTVYSTNPVQHTYTATHTDPSQWDFDARFVPPVILQRVVKNMRSVTFAGEDVLNGEPVESVDFTWNQGPRLRLVLSKADHIIRALRFLGPDPLVGDDEHWIEFSGDQTLGGLRFPARATMYQHQSRFLVMELADLRVNQAPDPAQFELPVGFVETAAAGSTAETTKIDENLYEVSGLGGGYRSQFVDVGDGVVVFEAPLNKAVTRNVLAEIRKTVGDKPIKYVVLSHYHDDHASGLGVYVKAGATIVTVKGNEDVLTRYARAGSALVGMPAQPELQPKYLDVTGPSLELAGATGRKLVVYRFQNLPHVNEMLALYDPATRSMITADFFTRFFSPASPMYQRFAEWLRSPAAPAVDRILGVHHPQMTKQAYLDLVLAGTH